MGEWTKPFQHTRMGQLDPWSQEAARAAQMQFGDSWPGIRDRIARFRSSGVGAPGDSKNSWQDSHGLDRPLPSAAPGYAHKTPEDQRLVAWLLESLLYGTPSGPIDATGKQSSTIDDEIRRAGNTAGSGYTGS